jgi:hypothetical protein
MPAAAGRGHTPVEAPARNLGPTYGTLMQVRTRLLAASVALALIGVTGAVLHEDEPQRLEAAPARPARPVSWETTTTSTTVPPTTTTVTTTPPPPTTAPPAVKASAAPASAGQIKPAPTLRTNAPLVPGDPARFAGFGAWIDVYDWSNEFTGGKPTVGPSDVDHMADMGVQTLYVQATKQKTAGDIVDPHLLRPIIDRAHQRGLRVITWYVPTLEDPALDLRKLLAIAHLGVEGIGVDIESRAVGDPAERSRRLVDLSVALRQHLPAFPISAVVMPAVVMEVINGNFWPGFPYRELAPAYDVWMPMNYWTSRTQSSGYRDAYRYTAENIDRLRAQLGRADLPVHPVGGIGDVSTTADIDGFRRASEERGVLGGSIYDYHTTHDDLWAHLQPFRR